MQTNFYDTRWEPLIAKCMRSCRGRREDMEQEARIVLINLSYTTGALEYAKRKVVQAVNDYRLKEDYYFTQKKKGRSMRKKRPEEIGLQYISQ